jgi:ferredoxin
MPGCPGNQDKPGIPSGWWFAGPVFAGFLAAAPGMKERFVGLQPHKSFNHAGMITWWSVRAWRLGLTPVLSMLHELAASRSDRDIWWLHGARGPNEHPFAAEAHDLLASLPHAREHVFYSAATPTERHSADAASGRITKKALARLAIPASGTAYVCGPASFMAGMHDALTALGLGPAAIHTELFGALAAINPGLTGQTRRSPHQPPGPPGTGHLVTFARSGITTPFGSGRRSVLDLADACDIPTRWSCRTGVCHTGVTPLLSGGIAYTPDPLELPADGEVLICCAQPSSDIVLDM